MVIVLVIEDSRYRVSVKRDTTILNYKSVYEID